MKNLLTTIVLISVTTILTLSSGCSDHKKVKPLRVGMELQYPPFEMADKNGKPSGISVDIAKQFGKYLERPVIIKPIAWTGLIPSLRTGKIDIIISSMSPTKERAKAVDFSIPYVTSGLALLVNSKGKINKFSDIKPSDIIAVKTGTVGDVFAHKNLPKNQIRQFDSVNACVLEIAQGRADAFIYGPLTLYQNHKKHPTTTRLILDRIPGTTNFSAMAVKKGNEKLLASANRFIRKTAKTDFFDKLGEKYLSDIKKMYKEKGLPFYFDVDVSKH